MPLYEYTCANNHRTIDLRRLDERNEPMQCPTCGQTAERGGPERAQFFMRYDATQRVAPKHPGMSGCQNPNRRVPAGTVR